ncbi:MAG: alpha/beta fold hydrolase [Syntrophobacteraceae bacterium]|nr:alpha/beta fold hydrolase [Syntrophobacteraceae bacterium]
MKTTDGLDFDDIDRIYHAWESNFTLSISPRSLAIAFYSWALHMMVLPGKRTELLMELSTKFSRYCDYLGYAYENREYPHCFTPTSQDRRFRGPEWNKWPFNAMAQGFLMVESFWQSSTTNVHGLSCHHENVVSFMIRQFLDIFAPSNFIATNPEVLARTREQSGANLARGWFNFLSDFKRALFREKPVGEEDFRVGENIAATPGKVIFRNRLIELIQYSPATGQVYAEPLLIVPAWIMKYYILDLSPRNSLAGYLVEKGYTVFMISWKNPDSEDRDICLDDYRTLGVMAALEVISSVVPERKIHTLGYCIGGNILSIAAAAMARDDDDRIGSVTLLTTQNDFTEAGELMLFIDECQVTYLEDIMWYMGCLDTRQMSGAFQLLRSNDLIWSRYIQDYLLGQRRPLSDLMAWNADTTRMPYRMHSQYLRSLFLDNDLATGRYIAGGRPIFLSDIKGPIFLVATLRDHVAPWRSVYKFLFQNNAEEITFVLCSGGHNAGIVSEPGGHARSFRMSTRKAGEKHIDPDSWLEKTPEQIGSWWTPWERWLAKRSSSLVDPPPMGAPDKGLQPLCDAPGTYVYGQ